jgi:hypothetical protein
LAASHWCKKVKLMTADRVEADTGGPQELLKGREGPTRQYSADSKQIRRKASKVLKQICLQYIAAEIQRLKKKRRYIIK